MLKRAPFKCSGPTRHCCRVYYSSRSQQNVKHISLLCHYWASQASLLSPACWLIGSLKKSIVYDTDWAKLSLNGSSHLTHWNGKFALFKCFDNIPVFLMALYSCCCLLWASSPPLFLASADPHTEFLHLTRTGRSRPSINSRSPPAEMPFLGQDWRSPGWSWTKTEGGWQRGLDYFDHKLEKNNTDLHE